MYALAVVALVGFSGCKKGNGDHKNHDHKHEDGMKHKHHGSGKKKIHHKKNKEICPVCTCKSNSD